MMNHFGIEKSVICTNSSIHFGSYQKQNNSEPDQSRPSIKPMKTKSTRKYSQKKILKKYYNYSFMRQKYDSMNQQHMGRND